MVEKDEVFVSFLKGGREMRGLLRNILHYIASLSSLIGAWDGEVDAGTSSELTSSFMTLVISTFSTVPMNPCHGKMMAVAWRLSTTS